MDWSNLAKVVYRRTYSRADHGTQESWRQTVERAIRGNLRGIDPKFLLPNEAERLEYHLINRKSGPAGRGWWFSGAPAHTKIGGVALNNCWFVTAEKWEHFVIAQDLLMLGGGVGMSVEHRFVSRLPKVKKNVTVVHQATKDADFIVPDSREGWCELTRRVMESFFVSGRSFSYSTVCIRGYGEKIAGFGGTASGPLPLITFIEKIVALLKSREGKHIRPIDSCDLLCAVGEMVVAGNVRRSAILVLGDPWDKEYLKAKRWDLGPIPTQRAMANFSVVADDFEDLHPLFWKTYEQGEPFGLVNRKNIQTYGRMGELKKDTAIGVNPCAEATLDNLEPCNLQEIALPNLSGEEEFIEAARLMHRWGKRVTLEKYHIPEVQDIIAKNRRIGTGITGCLQSPLFDARILDSVYAAIQAENVSYSKQLGIAESIRTTVVKPSGTVGKMMDCLPGIHPAFSQHMIQRIRFSANDSIIPLLRAAGHAMEPVQRFDGTLDHNTLVVDFYVAWPEGVPTAESTTTWQQLDVLLKAQRHWADQAVSVTVYYKKEEIPALKVWISENLKNLKTISFLCYNDHGFVQAPMEAITKAQYDKMSSKIRPIEFEEIDGGDMDSLECEGGACPIK